MKKNNKFIIVFLLIVIVIVIAGIIKGGNPFVSKSSIALKYLNKKYGDGNWEILSSEDYYYRNGSPTLFSKEFIKDGKKFKVSSSYLNGKYFYIYVNDSNMVTNDYFLPTYYSIKYNLNYEEDPNPERYTHTDLVDMIIYITLYHYPYDDAVFESSGWYFEKPYCRIDTHLVESFFSPISIQTSPKREKVLDIIPDNGSIPDIKDIINSIEEYYSSGRLKNTDTNEDELYDLVFNKKASKKVVLDYIQEHITPVDNMKLDYNITNCKICNKK